MDELRSAAVSCWRESNQARLRMLEAYAEIDRIGVDSLRLRGLVDLIGIDLRCTRSVANGVVRDLGRFAGRVSPAGVSLEPVFPRVTSALSDGLFSFDHARVIADTVEALPDELRARFGAAVEEQLVVHASELNPLDLQKLARRITARLTRPPITWYERPSICAHCTQRGTSAGSMWRLNASGAP